jgi:hypothetical protein
VVIASASKDDMTNAEQINDSIRSLLAHDGIEAVAVETGLQQKFFGDKRDVETRGPLGVALANQIALHTALGLRSAIRMVINEDPFGSISIITTTVHDMRVAVAVQTGHNVCKSLQRMLKRSMARVYRHRKISGDPALHFASGGEPQ